MEVSDEGFVSGLPLTPTKKDSIWVIVDRLTKSAHFNLIQMDYSLQKLEKLYISNIVRLYVVPISIISDRDSHFTSWFWKKLHEALGSRLEFSTILGPELVFDTDYKVRLIWDRLKAPFDRKKLYVDLKMRDIEYSVGYFVFLKVSPWKNVLRFGCNGKLSPRFTVPYRIQKYVGPVTYQLELPSELDCIHDVFHVSMLRRYWFDPSHVVSIDNIEVRPDLTFEEESVQILDCDIKVLRRKPIPLVKVLWTNHSTKEATWEPEDSMRQLKQRGKLSARVFFNPNSLAATTTSANPNLPSGSNLAANKVSSSSTQMKIRGGG
ncbi:uncharacterized protein LOC105763181 [Gossypium raimondii]|uniref:uncharacterized protein LOC105763181 n=1 Tax=Gossypium raimondii TaxID=29730 RepID=UPI00227AC0ED|nr:uncharacterized protein LOC105763181 [Gossypium raimondii]